MLVVAEIVALFLANKQLYPLLHFIFEVSRHATVTHV